MRDAGSDVNRRAGGCIASVPFGRRRHVGSGVSCPQVFVRGPERAGADVGARSSLTDNDTGEVRVTSRGAARRL